MNQPCYRLLIFSVILRILGMGTSITEVATVPCLDPLNDKTVT